MFGVAYDRGAVNTVNYSTSIHYPHLLYLSFKVKLFLRTNNYAVNFYGFVCQQKMFRTKETRLNSLVFSSLCQTKQENKVWFYSNNGFNLNLIKRVTRPDVWNIISESEERLTELLFGHSCDEMKYSTE